VSKDDYARLRFLVDDEHALAKAVRCSTEAGFGALMLRSVLCELLIGGDKLAGGERFASTRIHYEAKSVSFFDNPPPRVHKGKKKGRVYCSCATCLSTAASSNLLE
jgi:hypothetical protein